MNKLISVLSLCVLATTVVCADPVTVPNTFTAGTPANASEVNANFAALANAVNANAPLMVYDSNNKALGKYDGVGVITTAENKIFYLSEVRPAYLSDPSLTRVKIYFLGYNCEGPPYIEYSLEEYNRRFIQVATVYSNKAYIPDGSGFIDGLGQVVSGFYNGGCINFVPPESINLARALMIFDLSVFAPPFTIR